MRLTSLSRHFSSTQSALARVARLRSCFRGVSFLAILSLIPVFPSLRAQETPEKKAKDFAYLRCFGELGEQTSTDTYTLTCTGQKDETAAKPLFVKYKGMFVNAIGSGAGKIAPGKYRYTLSKDGTAEKMEAEADFEEGAIYTLLAFLDNGSPMLRIFKEYPILDDEGNTAPELQDGLAVYNLLSKQRLAIQVGESAPVDIPATTSKAFFLPSASLTEPAVLNYHSERERLRRKVITYPGHGRIIAVFMRNDYGQFTTTVLPAEPVQP